MQVLDGRAIGHPMGSQCLTLLPTTVHWISADVTLKPTAYLHLTAPGLMDVTKASHGALWAP